VATSTNPVGPLSPPTPPTPPSETAPGSTGGPPATGALKRGHHGSAVRALQERLELLGVMTVPVDEEFGPATEAAVTTIQRQLGLPPTGVVDRQTSGAIQAAAASVTVSTPTATDSLLREPQETGRFVVNETNKRLVITGDDGKLLVLAPLERRRLRDTDFDGFEPLLCNLERQSVVALPLNEASIARGLILGGVIWALIILGILGIFMGSSWYWILGPVAIGLATATFFAAEKKGVTAVRRWTGQLAALVVVLAVGIALPGAAIYFSAGVDVLVERAYMDGTISPERIDLTLLGRGLQLLFLAAVSLLPALLYFLFDRQQLGTLREQFERHMFRLDPSIRTLSDVRAKYGTLVTEVYGPAAARGGGRVQPGRRSPVLVATIVITLGWLLTLLNPNVGLITDRAGIVQLFQPDRSTIVFGFLGAYFFALMTIQRGYARGDLRPKTYTQITVRIFIAIIFAWVLELLPGDDDAGYLLLLAFAAGIVPETALVWIRENLRGEPGREFGRMIAERDPLTQLEGIDLYDRARLLDEGISNIEGLAHHDLIQLLLQTRIPAPRLVDWTDQAILYLHAGTAGDTGTENSSQITRQETLRCLKAFGIRTATDLEQAHWEATHRDDLEAFLKIVPPAGEGVPPRLSVILDTLRDEEWMANLRYWRDPVHLVEGTVEWPTPVSEAEQAPEEPDEAVLDASNGGNGLPVPATPASPAPTG
jgi:hypothetical protein